MAELVIRVENLGKLYHLGERLPYYTIRDTLARFLIPARRKFFSPLSSPGQTDSRNSIWALKDISFEIYQGEVVGIIGRNGAGKSTLLRVLSRITEPTEGWAKIHGRVGSLLEVGTGFHPELTGRENIYLNGAILGMKRVEINRKFEEIVAFAEIEKFMDTPVKHYSSGMYVRLAFAVAAHLQPDILLLDEILAVGDLAFQKKCFGKMGEVVKEGRAILLVSHNMQVVSSLCSRTICMDNGQIVSSGRSSEVVVDYLRRIEQLKNDEDISGANRPITSQGLKFLKLSILNSRGDKTRAIHFREPFEARLIFKVLQPIENVRVGVTIWTPDGTGISTTHHTDGGLPALTLAEGCYDISEKIENFLVPGTYILSVGAHDLRTTRGLDFVPEAAVFTVASFSETDSLLHDPYNRSFTYLPAQWQEPIYHSEATRI